MDTFDRVELVVALSFLLALIASGDGLTALLAEVAGIALYVSLPSLGFDLSKPLFQAVSVKRSPSSSSSSPHASSNGSSHPETSVAESLSLEEAAAVEASKRIIAKAREKFLRQNNGFVPMASKQVQEHLLKAQKMFERNLQEGRSSEDAPWVLQHNDAKHGVRIFSAEFPGKPCKRWRVECTLDTDLETGYAAVFEPEIRKQWDAMVMDIKMLKIFDCEKSLGDGLAVSFIATNPAAGGIVKSRSMLDLALQKSDPKGGIIICNCSCPETFPEIQLGPAPGSDGLVRATSHMGSGCVLKAIPNAPGKISYILVSTIELGGSLPPWIVNSAMTTSLAQGTRQMQEFLKKRSVASAKSMGAEGPFTKNSPFLVVASPAVM